MINLSGGDACGGHTRSHPEHDGEDPCGRWYYAGDGMGEQAAARHFIEKALSSGRTFYMPACINGRTFERQNDTNKKAMRAKASRAVCEDRLAMRESVWTEQREAFSIYKTCFACDDRSGADPDGPFLNADGVQNAESIYLIYAVHTLKTE